MTEMIELCFCRPDGTVIMKHMGTLDSGIHFMPNFGDYPKEPWLVTVGRVKPGTPLTAKDVQDRQWQINSILSKTLDKIEKRLDAVDERIAIVEERNRKLK